MPRLFTGLEIPADIGQSLSNLRGGLPGARWIDPENYHVTLRFIGDIDGLWANEIATMLFRVNRKPFEVKLQGLSSFGGRKPRAVVAAVEPSRPLIELQAELERMMQRMGLDPEGRKSKAGQKRKQLPEQGQIKQGKGKQRGSLCFLCLLLSDDKQKLAFINAVYLKKRNREGRRSSCSRGTKKARQQQQRQHLR